MKILFHHHLIGRLPSFQFDHQSPADYRLSLYVQFQPFYLDFWEKSSKKRHKRNYGKNHFDLIHSEPDLNRENFLTNKNLFICVLVLLKLL